MIPGWFLLHLAGSPDLANTLKHLDLPDSDAIAVESVHVADPLVLVTPSAVLFLEDHLGSPLKPALIQQSVLDIGGGRCYTMYILKRYGSNTIC